MKATYTVFVRQSNVKGTTFVDEYKAENIADAKQQALADAAKWQRIDESELQVLGVAEGTVNLVEWMD